MRNRMISTATLALALCVGTLALGAKDAAKSTKTHEGKFVSTSGDQFVMTDKAGKEHAHTLAADAKITCDGKACQAAELKSDMRIRVTTKPVAQKAVTAVDAIEEQNEFEQMHEGTVVSISGKKLTMEGKDGQEHAHTLGKDATVCCDGKACQATELKAGMRIRVTTKTDDKNVATRVEALGKQKSFAIIHEGTVASVAGEKLVMTDKDGKEHAHMLTADTAITHDGKVCKAADLKPETRVRVTISERVDEVVIRIEALDKQDEFVIRD